MLSQLDLYERAKNTVYYSILNYCESVKQKSILQDSPLNLWARNTVSILKRLCAYRNGASRSWWTDWPSRLCWDTHLCVWSALDSNVRLWNRPWNELGHVAAALVHWNTVFSAMREVRKFARATETAHWLNSGFWRWFREGRISEMHTRHKIWRCDTRSWNCS